MQNKFLDNTRIPNQPYPELRDVLNIFVADVKAELAENLIGIYLVGSLASGDFDLDSDIDFLVVTNTELTERNVRTLQGIQEKIHDIDCYPAKHLVHCKTSLLDFLSGKEVQFLLVVGRCLSDTIKVGKERNER